MKKSKVMVMDSEGQSLFECSLKDREKAFEYARQMEELGIEVSIFEPSLPETLATSLGMKEEEVDQFRKTIDDEIDSHGCCDD